MLIIIGDTHSKYTQYKRICERNDYTLQLGDLGFNYQSLEELDSLKHKFFKGNHDNHNVTDIHEITSNLGNTRYGLTSHGGVEFFFVSGEHSIDKKSRTQDVDWLENEELNVSEMSDCVKLYSGCKPDIVITHGAPRFICLDIGSIGMLTSCGYSPTWSSMTSKMLEVMWNIHQPKLFIHGHFHRRYSKKIGNTEFIGLEEFGIYQI